MLSAIDSIYRETISKLPLPERIEYCEKLIDKAQLNLLQNGKIMSAGVKIHLAAIIDNSRKELRELKKPADNTMPG